MRRLILVLLINYCWHNCAANESAVKVTTKESVENVEHHRSTVVISVLVRNKAHLLPHFFSLLENLKYPKNRINLWIRSDNNADQSIEIVNLWLNRVSKFYNKVNYKNDLDDRAYAMESAKVQNPDKYLWTQERHDHLINLKEEALNYARREGSDYIFFVDADVLLVRSTVIKELMELNVTIVTPKLNSINNYLNFWPEESDEHPTNNNNHVADRYNEQLGLFTAPVVHSAVLINLNDQSSSKLTFKNDMLSETFDYNGSLDDISIFSLSASLSFIPMFVCSLDFYGFVMPPLAHDENMEIEMNILTYFNINLFNYYGGVHVQEDLKPYQSFPVKDTLTLSKIFMINLERRAERRQKMEQLFAVIGLDVERYEAIDGATLTDEMTRSHNIRLFPGYRNPYTSRRITVGEIGCFLSHYNIWVDIVKGNLSEVLILEDDVLFLSNFKPLAKSILNEARSSNISWDLIYFGRIAMDKEEEEVPVPGTSDLFFSSFSLWANGYVLTLEGAKKLIAGNPLQRMLPVDEYIPIMYDKHPNDTLRNSFEPRNLVALGLSTRIIVSAFYGGNGEQAYFSDTGTSDLTTSDDQFTQADTKNWSKIKNAIDQPSRVVNIGHLPSIADIRHPPTHAHAEL